MQPPGRPAAPADRDGIPGLRQEGCHRIGPALELLLAAAEVDREDSLVGVVRRVSAALPVAEVHAPEPRARFPGVVVAALGDRIGPDDVAQPRQLRLEIAVGAIGFPQVAQQPVSPVVGLVEVAAQQVQLQRRVPAREVGEVDPPDLHLDGVARHPIVEQRALGGDAPAGVHDAVEQVGGVGLRVVAVRVGASAHDDGEMAHEDRGMSRAGIVGMARGKRVVDRGRAHQVLHRGVRVAAGGQHARDAPAIALQVALEAGETGRQRLREGLVDDEVRVAPLRHRRQIHPDRPVADVDDPAPRAQDLVLVGDAGPHVVVGEAHDPGGRRGDLPPGPGPDLPQLPPPDDDGAGPGGVRGEPAQLDGGPIGGDPPVERQMFLGRALRPERSGGDGCDEGEDRQDNVHRERLTRRSGPCQRTFGPIIGSRVGRRVSAPA